MFFKNSTSFFYLRIAFVAISSQSDILTNIENEKAKNNYALTIPYLMPRYPFL